MLVRKWIFAVWIFVAGIVSGQEPFLANNSSHSAPFIENKGQWDSGEAFRSDFAGGRLRVYNDKLVFAFLDQDDLAKSAELFHHHRDTSSQKLNELVLHGHVYHMVFLESNPHTQISGLEKQDYYHNYFIGNDKSKWAGNVPLFGGLVYRDLWEGIDMVIHEKEGNYKYDLVVKPGTNPELARLGFDGQTDLKIKGGSLIITTSVNKILEQKPFAYQVVNGKKKKVKCNYRLEGNRITFEFPEGYDKSNELIIDPQLVFSTYSGSAADNWGFTATYNDEGNLFGGGIAFNFGYPVTSGAFQILFAGADTDVSITKYNPEGTGQVYSTYLGGNKTDVPCSMIVDKLGNLIVFGITGSSNFPVSAEGWDQTFSGGSSIFFNGLNFTNGSDIFVTKFNLSGTELIGSTFVGSNGNDGVNDDLVINYGDQARGEVIIDESNQIYVVSSTLSPNFPTTSGVLSNVLKGSQDGVAFKMASDLSGLIWSTFIGGNGIEAAYSAKIGNSGEIFICGGTTSSNFPTTSATIHPGYVGNTDGFLISLNAATGSQNYGTYIGTVFYDQAFFVEVDENNDVYVMGQTKGLYPVFNADYSVPNSAQFIDKLTPELDESLASTVFGDGSRSNIDIAPTAFLVDNCGNIYVSGWGGNTNYQGNTYGLPISPDAYQSSTDGSDFYFIVIKHDFLDLLYATYFGGSGTNEHVDGGTSRFDKKGIIYQAVCAGCGGSSSFPTTVNAWSNTNNSYNCNLGTVKMDVGFSGVYTAALAEPNAIGCAPFTVDFISLTNGVDYIWDFGDGSPISTEENPIHTYLDIGTYDVTLIAIDSSLCIIADTTYLEVIVEEHMQPWLYLEYEVDCQDNQLIISSSNPGENLGGSFTWDMGDGTVYNTPTVVHSYDLPGVYTVSLNYSEESCYFDTTIVQEIDVAPYIDADFTMLDSNLFPLPEYGCTPYEINFQNQSSPADYYLWSYGDGTPIDSLENPTHIFTTGGTFQIQLIIIDSSSCNIADTVVQSFEIVESTVLLADFNYEADCEDSVVTFFNTGTQGMPFDWYIWQFGDGQASLGENPTHVYAENGAYDVTLTVTNTGICVFPDEITQTINVFLGVEIIADFNLIDNCEDTSVVLQNTGTPFNPNLEYQWDLGDGTVLYGENVEYTYPQPGTYTITLQLTDYFCDSVETQTQVVELPPVILALFEVEPGLEGCVPFEVNFINQSIEGTATSYAWDFGNNSGSNEINPPPVIYDTPSPDPVVATLVLSDPESCNLSDSYSVQLTIAPDINVEMFSDSSACYGDVIVLDAGNPGNIYYWSTGQTTQSISVTESGVYSVVVTNNICSDSATVQIQMHEHPNLKYTRDICEGFETEISTIINGTDVLWNTGEQTETIVISEGGVYTNNYLDDNGCSRSDSIIVISINESEQLFIPNSFSPDGDGMNDTWQPVGGSDNEFEVQVFDRWGNLIWETKDPEESWDGTYKGKPSQTGVYAYKVYFFSKCYSKTIETIGSVLLVR